MSFLQTVKSTVLITGGASGIGLALAKRLVALKHKVIVAGRRQHQLDLAQEECPGLVTIHGDVSTDEGRKSLFNKVILEQPNLNVLINNAGVNIEVPPLWETTDEVWTSHKKHLETDLEAPMHLSTLVLPHFMRRFNALIVNVSGTIAFVPMARYPSYSAAKAGLHSFSQSLRHQLRDSAVEVVEVIPPMVRTDILLDDMRSDGAIDVNVFAESVMHQLLSGGQQEKISHHTEKVLCGDREQLQKVFRKINSIPPEPKHSGSGK
eukprot:gene25875-32380_t